MNHTPILTSFLLFALLAGCVQTPTSDPFATPNDSPDQTWLYTGDLHIAMSQATRFKLSDQNPASRNNTILDTTDKAILADLKTHIVFIATNATAMCACSGDYTFEWFNDNTLLAQVTLHHFQHMRWIQHWDGDVELTPASAEWLKHFMPIKNKKNSSDQHDIDTIPP